MSSRSESARRETAGLDYYKAVSVNPKSLIVLRSNDPEFLEEANSLLAEHFSKKQAVALNGSNLMAFDESNSTKANGRRRENDEHNGREGDGDKRNGDKGNNDKLDSQSDSQDRDLEKRDGHKRDGQRRSDSVSYDVDFLKGFKEKKFDMPAETRNLLKHLCIGRGDQLQANGESDWTSNGQQNGQCSERQNGERQNGERQNGERQNGERQNGQRQYGERQNGGYQDRRRRNSENAEKLTEKAIDQDASDAPPPRRRRTDIGSYERTERTERQPYGPGRGSTESTGRSDFKSSDQSSPDQGTENDRKNGWTNGGRRNSFRRNDWGEKDPKIQQLVEEIKNIDSLPKDESVGGVNYEERYETKYAKYDNRSIGDRSARDKLASDKSAGDRSARDRSASNRSVRDKSAGDRSARDKSAGDRSARDRSASNRSVADKSTAVQADVESKREPEEEPKRRRESRRGDEKEAPKRDDRSVSAAGRKRSESRRSERSETAASDRPADAPKAEDKSQRRVSKGINQFGGRTFDVRDLI